MNKAVLTIITLVFTLVSVNGQSRYNADPVSSKIVWTGKKIGKEHKGTVTLKEGWLTWKNGQILSGEFIIDMNSIADNDLNDEKMKSMLEGHLKSEDFFGVEKYPDSKIVISEPVTFKDGAAVIKGELTIKGKTLPVEFNTTASEIGDVITYFTSISFDRSKYDVRYGSGSFFSDLGDKAIDDIITLDVTLVVKK